MAHTTSIGGGMRRHDLAMAALGLVSGIATVGLLTSGDAIVEYLKWLDLLAIPFGFSHPGGGPFLMGLFFCAAVAAGVWLATANPWSIPVLLITTMYAWSAAIQVAGKLLVASGDGLYLIAASLAAGAVGAGITHLGCALFSRELRRPAWIVLTIIVGALAGMLLYASQHKYVGEWLLYIVWQPVVAFAIGLGLERGQTGRI
jgi:hypothetical protein